MSFQDLQRENVGNRSSRAPSQSQGVAAGIFQINTAVSGFRRLVDAIGTSKDTPDHRQKLHATRQRILQLVKETSAKLKSVSQSDRGANANPNKRIEDAKLARDFQTTLQEFQKVQQLASERESMFSPSFPPSSSGTVSDSGDIQHLVSNKGMNHFLWNKRVAQRTTSAAAISSSSSFQLPSSRRGGAAAAAASQQSKHTGDSSNCSSSNFEEEKSHIGFRLLIVLIGYLKILIKIFSFDRGIYPVSDG